MGRPKSEIKQYNYVKLSFNLQKNIGLFQRFDYVPCRKFPLISPNYSCICLIANYL